MHVVEVMPGGYGSCEMLRVERKAWSQKRGSKGPTAISAGVQTCTCWSLHLHVVAELLLPLQGQQLQMHKR